MNKKNYNYIYFMTYFIMISFLHPRGFEGIIPGYKIFFTASTWFSCVMILVLVINAFFKYDSFYKKDIFIVMNFALILLITIIEQKGIGEGKQQLLAYPFLTIYTVYEVRRKPINFLNVINNILIVFLTLNLIIDIVYPFEEHMTFLGHVQVIAQYGILSIFTSILMLILGYKQFKKIFIQIVLTIINLLLTDASSAILTCLFFILFLFIYIFRKKYKKIWNFFLKKTTLFYCLLLILNFIFILIACNTSIFSSFISGREFIWKEAFGKIKKHWILGYGIQGVLLKPFWLSWTNSNGFNYGHNQLVQLLLDGGLVWFISITLSLYELFKKIRPLNKTYLFLLNTTLITFLIFMIFDAPSLYCYIYIYISILYGLGIKYERRENLYGYIKRFKQRNIKNLLSD